ncbi:MAG: ATP-binding protein [Desulfatiglans sp.]|nr:ATP-binding protein [Desulfatiglans sp.]
MPEAKYKLWLIRYAVLSPYAFAVYLFSYAANFKKYMQLSIASTVLVSGLCIIAMILIAPYPASHSYYAGLILVFIYGYAFFRLRFIWASLAGWTIVLAYEIAAIWLSPTSIPILVNNNFFFLAGNVIGMFACYSIEYYLRRDFVQAGLLEEEKKKVTEINLDLERRVDERTAQLKKSNQELNQEIEERTQAEEALRESEEKFRLLVENADMAIFIGQDRVIKFPNPKTSEMLGYSGDELATMPFRDLIHPDDRHLLLGTDEKESSPSAGYTFRIINKKKQELWIRLNTVSTTWEGRPGVLNFARDISSQKRMEIQLEQARKMEAIGTLAGGVAHDLNNILSGIVSYPELLLLDIPENSRLRKPLLTIQESGQKAAAIVQDLLTLARRGVPVTKIVDLNQVIQQYLKSPEYRKLLSYHPYTKVRSDLVPNVLNIMGSPVHLSKTVMNLVSNAAEAMPQGGTILVKTGNQYIDAPIQGYESIDEGDYVVLTISDTGTGIPSRDLNRIFEPFYTKKKMGRSGTGLGMAVVWGTMKDHKGYIDLESTEGKGTRFRLYFPVTRQTLHQEEPLSLAAYKGRGESILVVDDIEEQRMIASEMLEKLGYKVASVSSGEEAIAYIRENPTDLMVLDMIMEPGMDGLETYKRAIELYPDQKAIIASGFSETDRVRKAQDLGVKAYLRKPYSFEKMGLAVKAGLDHPVTEC